MLNKFTSNSFMRFFKQRALLSSDRGRLLDCGFHGDRYILGVANLLLQHVEYFIETGTNLGSTACYVAKTHPRLKIFTCEPNNDAYLKSRSALEGYPNASISNIVSPDFLHYLHRDIPDLESALSFYWLDAHGYGYKWPLLDEISFLTGFLEKGCICIDDFLVPGRPEFKYDKYGDQECSFDYIEKCLAKGLKYQIIYPDYSESTSEHHPLTGVVFIMFGDHGIDFSNEVFKCFKFVEYES